MSCEWRLKSDGLERGRSNSQSIHSSVRRLLSAVQTINPVLNEPSRLVFVSISADLVFDYGISEVIRKIARGGHVLFLLHVLSGTGSFGQNLQLVLDRLESSETGSTETDIRSGWEIRTRTNSSVA